MKIAVLYSVAFCISAQMIYCFPLQGCWVALFHNEIEQNKKESFVRVLQLILISLFSKLQIVTK